MKRTNTRILMTGVFSVIAIFAMTGNAQAQRRGATPAPQPPRSAPAPAPVQHTPPPAPPAPAPVHHEPAPAPVHHEPAPAPTAAPQPAQHTPAPLPPTVPGPYAPPHPPVAPQPAHTPAPTTPPSHTTGPHVPIPPSGPGPYAPPHPPTVQTQPPVHTQSTHAPARIPTPPRVTTTAGGARVQDYGDRRVVVHPNGTKQQITKAPGGHEVTRTYDANGRKTSAVVMDSKGRVISKDKISYDRNGKKTGITRVNAEGNTIYSERHTANGGIIRKNGDGRVVYQVTRTADRHGHMNEVRTVYRGGRPYVRNYIYVNHVYYGHTYYGYRPHSDYWYGVRFYTPFYVPYYGNPYYYNPFVYTWGYYNDPWYGHYGYYYRPYARYRSLSAWMVDYTFSALLAEQYAVQNSADAPIVVADSQTGSTDPDAGITQGDQQQAELSDDVKDVVREQVEQEMTARSNEDETQRTIPLETKLNDPKHVYVVSQETETQDQNGDACLLTQGDLVKAVNNPDGTSTVSVVSSKKEDCAVNATVTLTTEQLIGFENDFNAKLDEAAEKAKTDEKVKALMNQ